MLGPEVRLETEKYETQSGSEIWAGGTIMDSNKVTIGPKTDLGIHSVAFCGSYEVMVTGPACRVGRGTAAGGPTCWFSSPLPLSQSVALVCLTVPGDTDLCGREGVAAGAGSSRSHFLQSRETETHVLEHRQL